MPTPSGERPFDWGRTSGDYAMWRPGYPPSFYNRLYAHNVGVPGQRIVDLGTGTGVLARAFGAQGARVTGVDVSAGQVAAARELAAREALDVTFHEAPAEDTALPSGAWEVVTAGQCWLYFDVDRATAEVKRLLTPDGLLVTCHLCYLPRHSAIARATEALVLEHNPTWTGANWEGRVPPMPSWAEGRFELVGMFQYDENVSFTRESWRGRIRAHRGVSATLDAEEVAAFDDAHRLLLESIAPERFDVLHRIDAHLYRRGEGAT